MKILYQSEFTTKHDVVFLMATNEFSFLENSEENAKRIRVINWDNSIPKEKMDFKFLDKLTQEAPAIIVKCLRSYATYIEQRLPITNSTNEYMKRSGCNSNHVLNWIEENNITKGSYFCTTSTLFFLYRAMTLDKQMNKFEFGRKFKSSMGDTAAKESDQRGYMVSKNVREFEVRYSDAIRTISNSYY
ncbi:MAG: hypothetical protein HQK52_23830 [Oligoflexia bacterium]|nr:hypothetical protein [Oligoflexia bacterium]